MVARGDLTISRAENGFRDRTSRTGFGTGQQNRTLRSTQRHKGKKSSLFWPIYLLLWLLRQKPSLTASLLTACAIIQIARVHLVTQTRDSYSTISRYSDKPIAVSLEDNARSSVNRVDLSQFFIKEAPKKIEITRPPKPGYDYYSSSEDQCEYMYDWQTTFNTACNSVHEIDLLEIRTGDAAMVNSGENRDVWEVKDSNGTRWALKTFRWEKAMKGFTERRMQAQRTDAIISEKLTFSPYVASIFGYCGMSALYENAPNGTLKDHYKELNKRQRLRVAASISRALAHAHTLGGGPKSPVVHCDIDHRQILYLNGEYVLSDWNIAGLLMWNKSTNETCGWPRENFVDYNRSPEEKKERWNYIDEKVDVYSLGNIFYRFLTNRSKYSGYREKKATGLILAGDIPRLSDKIENSKDPVDVALLHAMHRCLVFDSKERATAKEIADYLFDVLDKIERTETIEKR